MAGALPWKQILRGAALAASLAGGLIKRPSPSKAVVPPPPDAAADLRLQLDSLARRVQDLEAAQAEQARVLAQVAEQLEAMARRAARGAWVGWAALAVAVGATVLALLR